MLSAFAPFWSIYRLVSPGKKIIKKKLLNRRVSFFMKFGAQFVIP